MPWLSLWLISLVANGIIKCSPTLSRLFHGWFSSLAITFIQREIRWNPAQHSVWTDDDYNMMWGKKSCCSSESVTNEWHRSRVVLTSVVPMMHCRRANSVSTFWPEMPVPYVNCTCDCAGTKTQSMCIRFPHFHHRHSPDTAWTECHTVACYMFKSMCLCWCECPRIGVGPSAQSWCVSLSAVVHRRSETSSSPSTHTNRSTYKHMPYKHDQKWTSKKKLTQGVM